MSGREALESSVREALDGRSREPERDHRVARGPCQEHGLADRGHQLALVRLGPAEAAPGLGEERSRVAGAGDDRLPPPRRCAALEHRPVVEAERRGVADTPARAEAVEGRHPPREPARQDIDRNQAAGVAEHERAHALGIGCGKAHGGRTTDRIPEQHDATQAETRQEAPCERGVAGRRHALVIGAGGAVAGPVQGDQADRGAKASAQSGEVECTVPDRVQAEQREPLALVVVGERSAVDLEAMDGAAGGEAGTGSGGGHGTSGTGAGW